ncbi:type II CAAX endopeptidase family protein [Rhodobacterales bacterium FZCC0083]|nr:type II CAAX endopeptidase family protein [Rhodobacterales bacterium FZCC0083]
MSDGLFHPSVFGNRSQIWRICLGLFLISIIYVFSSFGWFIVLDRLAQIRLEGLGSTPADLAVLLFSFFFIWLGIALVCRWLHRHPLHALYGPTYKINWQHFLIGAGLAFATAIISETSISVISWYFFDSSSQANPNITTTLWLRCVIPISALIFVQIGAEEMLFRGYLLQHIRARGGRFWWSIFLPSFLFGMLHFDFPIFGVNAFFYMLHTSVAGIILCLVTLKTGNLGAALGLHFGVNALMLIFGLEGHLDGISLFVIQLDPKGAQATLSFLIFTLFEGLAFLIWLRWINQKRGQAFVVENRPP